MADPQSFTNLGVDVDVDFDGNRSIYSLDSSYSPRHAGLNQPAQNGIPHHRIRTAKLAAFVSGSGNFAIQYSISSLSIAMQFMASHEDVVSDDLTGDFPTPGWAKYSLKGGIFGGIVIGMLLFGYLGDLLGRRKGLIMTLSLLLLGTACSALAAWGTVNAVYSIILASRVLTGVGVGGLYPLSFTMAVESGKPDEDREKLAAWAYLYQMPGSMAPYAVAWALLALPAGPSVTSLQFRLILGLGVLPVLLTLVGTLMSRETKDFRHASHKESPITVARQHPEYFKLLIGTAGCWCLYDISYYGTAIFTPNILQDIFGNTNSLSSQCWQSLVLGAITIPGTLAAIAVIRKGGRWLNIVGFMFNAVVFAFLAILYLISDHGLTKFKFVVLCLINFALSWGPSVGVHILPPILFPTHVRATFIGLSSAGGKVGALMGSFSYPALSNAGGMQAVLWAQVGLSLAGVVLSWHFLPKDLEQIERFHAEARARKEQRDLEARLSLTPRGMGTLEVSLASDKNLASLPLLADL